uniref:Uncharacterized protein n=1 Tax=Sphaerodactylus townsendi TaxID=933632 RepID=A0ACB8EGT4_9SAUR
MPNGGVVAFNAHAAMKKAKERAASAEDMIDHCWENEQKHYQEFKMCAKQLEEEEARIQENQRRIEAIVGEKHKLVKFHEETLNLQEALRRCCHFVGTLASEVNAVKVTCQYICIYESLRQQLEEMNRQVLPLLGAKGMEADNLAVLSSLPSNISEVEITRL